MDYKKIFDLAGRAAVVTGASSGIGRAIALGLAAHGADVLVAERNPQRTAETAEKVAALGRRSIAFELEVSRRDSAQAMAARAISISSKLGHPARGAYASSKGGLIQLTKVMASEWAPYNVCVNAISAASDFITGHNLIIDGGRTVD